MEQLVDNDTERKEILKRYRNLLKAYKSPLSKGDKRLIRLAFNMALEAHREMRRKSGEPYIYHPIAVAQITAEEIGLGTTSIVAALLHDVVEDTDITLEDIERTFGKKISSIIDGLTKISGVFDQNSTSLQAENFRKMLLTLSDDVRVILIKLADRLHNMRTLESMSREKQLKIASETNYLYAPLAHRLGLYVIKTELEDLALKYTEPEIYKTIARKLEQTRKDRTKFINEFSEPIKESLGKNGFRFEIKGRPKSIYSIWNKMKKQDVPFEEIYDLFAIRIIIDTAEEKEKSDCWKVYSIVTDFYHPNPDRLRDWISIPKANGYESLHTTVMGPGGKWVEVQIRSKRMDEIAEKGYAAHWKYKDTANAGNENALDEWLHKIREMLENPDANALDFIDDFKLNLFAEEIFVFTPKGEIKTLPVNSTCLDFAFEIHSALGTRCIGAKVNHKLVPLSYKLQSGDQIEIITSAKQNPREEWLGFIVTAKAKSKIKAALKEEKRKTAEEGKNIIEKLFRQHKISFNKGNINEILSCYRIPSSMDLFYRIAIGAIDLKNLEDFNTSGGQIKIKVQKKDEHASLEQLVKEIRGTSGSLVIGDNLNKINYQLSECCTPIAGDDVFGFITDNEGILIHRVNCPKAIQLMSNFSFRIVKAKWTSQKEIIFLAGIRITGLDNMGVVNNITKIISSELKVNIRSINIESNDGMFEGTIMLFVHDTEHLNKLIRKLTALKGILTVSRIDNN